MKKLMLFGSIMVITLVQGVNVIAEEDVNQYLMTRAQEITQENRYLRSALSNPDFTLGFTAHYSPNAAAFVSGSAGWTYIQDSISIGLYSILPIDETGTALYLKDRVIFGASDKENGAEEAVAIVGNILEAKLSLSEFIIVNYEFQYYWGGEKVSPNYGMCSGSYHKVGIDVNVPLWSARHVDSK